MDYKYEVLQEELHLKNTAMPWYRSNNMSSLMSLVFEKDLNDLLQLQKIRRQWEKTWWEFERGSDTKGCSETHYSTKYNIHTNSKALSHKQINPRLVSWIWIRSTWSTQWHKIVNYFQVHLEWWNVSICNVGKSDTNQSRLILTY